MAVCCIFMSFLINISLIWWRAVAISLWRLVSIFTYISVDDAHFRLGIKARRIPYMEESVRERIRDSEVRTNQKVLGLRWPLSHCCGHTNEWRRRESMLSFVANTLCCEVVENRHRKMPRVVSDQRAKFDNDELFRKLSRESEVSDFLQNRELFSYDFAFLYHPEVLPWPNFVQLELNA